MPQGQVPLQWENSLACAIPFWCSSRAVCEVGVMRSFSLTSLSPICKVPWRVSVLECHSSDRKMETHWGVSQ